MTDNNGPRSRGQRGRVVAYPSAFPIFCQAETRAMVTMRATKERSGREAAPDYEILLRKRHLRIYPAIRSHKPGFSERVDMPLLHRYAIWNNKGGVGKSTIAFHIASRYAELNKSANVLVIDLCPQANSSMMLFGGGTVGESRVLERCTQPVPQTVVGYLSHVLSSGSGAALPDPFDFVTRVADFNSDMPENLYLLCGDGNLEPMAPAISGAATQPALTPAVQPWKWVHLVFRKLTEHIAEVRNEKDWLVFVDTNPSFSIYTELAISSADRLITPVNADDSSRVATNAMFILLHGQIPPHPVYGSWTYAAKAAQHQLDIPEIHLVVGNRLTQYGGAAEAFAALSDATADSLFEAFQRHPEYFTSRAKPPLTKKRFRTEYSVPLRDFNTAGVVAAHLGRRLSSLSGGYYEVHGNSVQVNRTRVQECLAAIDGVVNKL